MRLGFRCPKAPLLQFWIEWMNWTIAGKGSPNSFHFLKNGLNSTARLPKFFPFVEFDGLNSPLGSPNSFHLLNFGVIFQKMCLNAEHFTSKQPWNILKIVKPAPKIVKLTAGAKKNSRKEIKRVKTTIFKYVFLIFWSFRKKLKNKSFQGAGHLVSALLVAGSATWWSLY